MTLTLNKWLSLFTNKETKQDHFIKTFKIRYSNGTTSSLEEHLKKKPITKSILKILFHVFEQDRKRYLTNFYKKSLDVSSFSSKQKLPLCIHNDKYSQNKNIIRNTYYKEILHDTNTIQPNVRNYYDVVIDLYKHKIIDYKLITPSSLKLLEKGTNLSSILSAYYFRSSIMNPTIPYAITTLVESDKIKVFTPTLGWSSYAYGVLSNPNLYEYVGIDVLNKVCNNTRKLLTKNNIQNEIRCEPSENVAKDKTFLQKYKNHFDLIFFSPPYYELELYSGKLQSTNKYKTYTEWLEKYWTPTIKMCHHILGNQSLMCYIVSGYNYKGHYLNLSKDMNAISEKEGFDLIRSVNISSKNVKITKHRKLGERIYIFKKEGYSVSERVMKKINQLTKDCKTTQRKKRNRKNKTRKGKVKGIKPLFTDIFA